MVSMSQALAAKEEVKKRLRGKPGVNGIGITWDENGDPCVRVNLEDGDPQELGIPLQVNDVPVIVARIGRVRLE
jgi:hypothetical protein